VIKPSNKYPFNYLSYWAVDIDVFSFLGI